jgi:signal transduction histidine kinase
MRLAPRLLIVSLVTLLLPWAGCQYLANMRDALRDGQASAVRTTSEAVAGLLESRPGWFDDDLRRLDSVVSAPEIFVHPLSHTPVVDGFVEDWGVEPRSMVPLQGGPSGPETIEYVAGESAGFLWLFIRVVDDDVTFGSAGRGDGIRVRVGSDSAGLRDLLFRPMAPGPLSATGFGWLPDARISAYWQVTSTGYNLELRMPLVTAGERLGFIVTDRDSTESSGWTAGTMSGAAADPGWLVRRRTDMSELLGRMRGPGLRLRVVDRRGWVVAESGGRSSELAESPSVGRLMRIAMSDKDNLRPRPTVSRGALHDAGGIPDFVHWKEAGLLRFRQTQGRSAILAAIRPLNLSDPPMLILLAEQDTATILSVTDKAAISLFGFSIASMLIVALVLVGFATWLSLRIRKLSRAASNAMSKRGELTAELPEAGSGDELGDLSRDFSSLLTRVRDYNLYLRSLGDKLTHELRTPMTVVGTSLENLAGNPGGDQAPVYLKRAREGIERLRAMVNALGSATRIEESIAGAVREPLDLAGLVAELGSAYAAPQSEQEIRTIVEPASASINGSADLLVQMLDKLFENARDFCPPGGVITLFLEQSAGHYELGVRNTGSELAAQPESLFDSLVSRRPGKSEQPHLGLGLYIVRLVAEFHEGRVTAANLPDGRGVEFRVTLPTA